MFHEGDDQRRVPRSEAQAKSSSAIHDALDPTRGSTLSWQPPNPKRPFRVETWLGNLANHSGGHKSPKCPLEGSPTGCVAIISHAGPLLSLSFGPWSGGRDLSNRSCDVDPAIRILPRRNFLRGQLNIRYVGRCRTRYVSPVHFTAPCAQYRFPIGLCFVPL